MTLPASIRVNTLANFPSLVYSTTPVTINKANGIWTVGFSIGLLGTQSPPAPNYPTDYLIVWDSLVNTHFKMSITNLLSSIAITTGAARTQRTTTVTPIVVQPTDQIISCKITSAAACTLPAAASRAGVPITFKDLGQATANNITLTPNGAETIDGMANYVLRNNFAWVTLVPFNDGTNSGWMVQ